MLNQKIYSYFNYLFIAIVLLWPPLQGTVLTFDGKGRIILMLTLMAFIVNCNKAVFSKLLFSKPIVFWLVWCVYVSINTYMQGYENPRIGFLFFAINQIFCPCMIMAVSAYEYIKNSSSFLKVVLWIFLIYAFLGTFVMDIGYLSQDMADANTLGNALALNVMLIIFFVGVLYCRQDITLTKTVALVLFAIGIVVVSATRKALGAGVIMIIALILSQIKFTFSNILKIILPIIVLYYGFGFVMNNTQMGERIGSLEETVENIDKHYNIGDSFFLKAMGDRSPQYILGTKIFVEHPVTGIGLNNFCRVSGYPLVLHTEYMVQLCECGLIGCILFIAFYVSIIKKLFKRIRLGGDNKKIAIMMLGTIAALLFVYLTAWSYSFPFYFAVLGTIVGFIHSKETKIKKLEI